MEQLGHDLEPIEDARIAGYTFVKTQCDPLSFIFKDEENIAQGKVNKLPKR